MADIKNDKTQVQPDVVNRLVRVVILIIVSFLISVAAVSFAVHHMRLQFEGEFKGISDTKVEQICDVVKMTVKGDDITADQGNAAQKYGAVLDLMLSDTSTENLSTESYALFAYSDGQLSLLLSQGASDASEFAVANREISEWLNGTYDNTTINGANFESVIVPITDSNGMCVGVFEYKVSFDGLYGVGDTFESRVLFAVVISVVAGIILFVIQEMLIKFMRRKQGSDKNRGETIMSRDRRLTSSTIGYCFAIVLVVLFVMSAQLSSFYIKALESERADAMEECALTSATALSYTTVAENMTYALPIYNYGTDKPYIVNIYTMAGDSFLRLYSSTADASAAQYYLTGVGDQYINCFQLQEVTLTTRSENGVSYVTAIAPIISSDNTVSGILEIMMPRTDFESTVNGMSLSWIFTIISIAISMGIVIFELNLLISTVSKGVSGNSPVLVMYGENACRFLSFFMAFGAIMVPISFADYYKDSLEGKSDILIQSLIAASVLLFSVGFFGMSDLRQFIKSKITERIAVLSVTAFGFFLALASGIVGVVYFSLVLALPIGFCFGMPFSYLRDYRINAGKLGYKDFSDRTIHNVQSSSYFLGVSVGAVIAGICYERYGSVIVALISGISLFLSAVGMVYFMQNNNSVREAHLSISSWLQTLSDSNAGRFLNSSFLVLGIALSFLLVFIPNYLEKVGISLATSSFYFLLCWFFACIVCGVLKNRGARFLTSRVRVTIQALSVTIGLLAFAIAPSAKMLVVTVAFLGISLGIHDFYYIYVLFLICNKRIKVNLRRCAEYTFYFGFGILVPVIMCAFILGKLRLVFLITAIVVGIIAFIYPASPFSGKIDEADSSMKHARQSKSDDSQYNYAQPVPVSNDNLSENPAADSINGGDING